MLSFCVFHQNMLFESWFFVSRIWAVLAGVRFERSFVGIAVVLLHFRPLPEPLRAKPALELLTPLVLVIVVSNQTVTHCTSEAKFNGIKIQLMATTFDGLRAAYKVKMFTINDTLLCFAMIHEFMDKKIMIRFKLSGLPVVTLFACVWFCLFVNRSDVLLQESALGKCVAACITSVWPNL